MLFFDIYIDTSVFEKTLAIALIFDLIVFSIMRLYALSPGLCFTLCSLKLKMILKAQLCLHTPNCIILCSLRLFP